ncbi:MAG: helix-turn-helix transcriptional regulator [Actinobacteria bacterium]|jgi:transcriptional regulator with XRE-family HTH domain|nr:helix-turn-helix transcriptional regulator [Actinomycetota bacterium]
MNDASFKDWISMSDKALIDTIGFFIQHNRLNQNKSQGIVARDAGISRSTLSLVERGEKISLSSLIKILRVLDLLYIMNIFKIENEISPVEYAKLKKNERQRARSKVENDDMISNEDLE